MPAGAIEAGIYVNMKEAGLSNYSKVNPLAFDGDYSLPYRGSQVLLAFDTTKLPQADAPTTFDALVEWIKANPGQFIYNRPDKGGSGGNFVRRTIHQANGLDPSAFTDRELHRRVRRRVARQGMGDPFGHRALAL